MGLVKRVLCYRIKYNEFSPKRLKNYKVKSLTSLGRMTEQKPDIKPINPYEGRMLLTRKPTPFVSDEPEVTREFECGFKCGPAPQQPNVSSL